VRGIAMERRGGTTVQTVYYYVQAKNIKKVE
jgi:hypothetical protein